MSALLWLLAACTAYEPPADVFTLGPSCDTAETACPFADSDVPLPVAVELTDSDAFSGWSSWPTLEATLSSGAWIGDGDNVASETISERVTVFAAAPDPDATALEVAGELTVNGAVYRAETTIGLCPAEIAFVDLAVDVTSVAEGSAIELSARPFTPTGGRPSVATSVTFGVASGASVEFERPVVLLDSSGTATTRVRVGAGATSLSFHAVAEPPERGVCPRAPVESLPLTVSVTPAETGEAAPDDTGDGADDAG